MRVLLTGWFSFEQMGASAGDMLCRELLANWLRDASIPFDMAVAAPFFDGVDWRNVDPSDYTDVIFVCGPFGNGPPLSEFLSRFRHARIAGINLSMLQSLDEWNPFDLLIERDSSRTTRPDLSFLSPGSTVPVIGLILAHHQQEYGDRARHREVDSTIMQFLAEQAVAVIPIDTRLDKNNCGFRNAAQVESVIDRMDAVVTTRLHGMVLSIQHGVPPVCVDPIADGEKVRKQVEALDWPILILPESLTMKKLAESLSFCLSAEARIATRRCRDRAKAQLEPNRTRILSYLSSSQNKRQ